MGGYVFSNDDFYEIGIARKVPTQRRPIDGYRLASATVKSILARIVQTIAIYIGKVFSF